MAEVFSSSLRQNNLTKTNAQINDCLFIYMKFETTDHAIQHVSHFVRRKKWFVCACGVLHYGQFQSAAVKHIKFIDYPLCTLCCCTF